MPALQQGVLFGGQDSQNRYLNDTWIWKAGCFTQATPVHSPPPLENPSAAYDGARGVVVMYGDALSSTSPTVGTWTWNGSDWTAAASTVPEFPAPTLASDAQIQEVVLFGETLNGGTPQTWAWDGAHWKQLTPKAEPPARQQASMALDPATHMVILFGGIAGADNQELGDTWSWNGSDWLQIKPSTNPPPRADAVLVSATAQGRLLLVGGEHAPTILGDAWAWDGSNWVSVASIGPRGAAGAIDTGSEVVLFGGWSATQTTNETWVWNGSAWASQ